MADLFQQTGPPDVVPSSEHGSPAPLTWIFGKTRIRPISGNFAAIHVTTEGNTAIVTATRRGTRLRVIP